MIIVANRIPVNPDHTEVFEEVFSQRASLVDQMDGFILFQLLRPQKEGDPYIVQTYWKSMAHFEGWTNSDEFKQQHGRDSRLPEGAVLARPQIEIHEIIQNTAKITEVTEA